MAHSPGFSLVRRLLAVAGWARLERVPAAEAIGAFAAARIGRRRVMQGAAGAAVIAVVPGSGCKDSDADDSGDDGASGDARIAVIGAGIAGLHAAHRLAEAGLDVTVYEGQDRVGGRMWTDRETFGGGMLFELGGELIDSNHATMWALAEELGIALDDRWSFEPAGMIRETNYVAGERVTNATLLEQTLAVAGVMATQVEMAESDDAAFEELDAMSLQAWLETYVPAATYPELHEVLRVAFVGEYGLEADAQGCLNLLYLFGWDSTDEFLIFGESDERWHTQGGNDLYITALADAIGSDAIRTGMKLTSASGGTEGPYQLTFEDGTEVEVDRVVFALPFTKLRQVDLSDLELSEEKRQIIAELGYGTNAKIMGRFARRPWWEDQNESGLLTTDLGVQQGWDTTIGQDVGEAGVWTNFVGGDQGVASGSGTAEAWFQGILADLEEIWPGTMAAWEGTAARMHWPTFEWAEGSYTCYRVGQWAFWSLEGAREGNVHFCGEHCSLDFQGWMEGAAETGGLVAAEILDDLGVPHSEGLKRALATKLALPQAAYRRPTPARLPWRSRRRLRLALAGR